MKKEIAAKGKVAIIHDYLFQYGGAEKVVEAWLEIYPEAVIYTSMADSRKFTSSKLISKAFEERRVITSAAQILFSYLNLYRFQKHFFWLYPLTMRFMNINNYELVLISSTYCAKNVRINNCKNVISYVHTPTRFLHGLITETDHSSLGIIYRLLIPFFIWWLRILDLKAVKYLETKKTKWIGNSKYIQSLIKEIYHVEASVVYPPINLDDFLKIQKKVDNEEPFYYFLSRISFHKRVDLILKACIELKKKVLISGTSALPAEIQKLKKIVNSYPDGKKYVKFLGRTSQEDYFDYLSKCLAFIYPPKEDFGIAPVEALASGTPVIAFGEGGALEYVKPNINGLLFKKQEIEVLKETILEFEKKEWDPILIKSTVKHFSKEVHQKQIQKHAS